MACRQSGPNRHTKSKRKHRKMQKGHIGVVYLLWLVLIRYSHRFIVFALMTIETRRDPIDAIDAQCLSKTDTYAVFILFNLIVAWKVRDVGLSSEPSQVR